MRNTKSQLGQRSSDRAHESAIGESDKSIDLSEVDERDEMDASEVKTEGGFVRQKTFNKT